MNKITLDSGQKITSIFLMITLAISSAYFFFIQLPNKEYRIASKECIAAGEKLDQETRENNPSSLSIGHAIFNSKRNTCLYEQSIFYTNPPGVWSSLQDLYKNKNLLSYRDMIPSDKDTCVESETTACSNESFNAKAKNIYGTK